MGQTLFSNTDRPGLLARVPATAALVVLLGASALLAASVSDEWFTPLFMLRSRGLPGARWLVAAVQVVTLMQIANGRVGWGASVALLVAIANVLALPFNFFAAWVGLGYDGRTDPLSLRFWLFYIFQLVIVVLSWRALRRLPASERRYQHAALVAGAYGILFFLIAALTMPAW